jgi:ferredoxin
MEKQPTELALADALEAYPGDPSLDVCPSRAIEWDADSATAAIIASDCIGCGLCVSRCPYGAISLDGTNGASVATDDPNGLVVSTPSNGTHPSPSRSGDIASLDSPIAAALLRVVPALSDTRAALFIRNLLNEIGMNARVRRRGDTNMRIDAVGYSRSERPFVAEIELSNAVLDSPRALLEDVAVLHDRYGYAVADIDAVSIILAFPNVRSEYYQVIRDIETILGIRVRTITVGAFIALLWSNASLDGFSGDAFAVGLTTPDLAGSLGLKEPLAVEPYPGAFRPSK